MFSQDLLSRLRRAESIAIFTGAGMSAESGVPTFRGENGIWKKFKPEELASFDAFIRNPDLVWEWYKQRKLIVASIRPNAGHYALAEMENYHRRFTVITQNIDNLHRRAGSKRVYELHGNIERNYCISCKRKYSNEEIFQQERAPHCTKCGGLIRPDVVWFGELLPLDEWDASAKAVEHAEIFFSIGTSGVVYPAVSLIPMAKKAGAYVVEINVEETEFSMMADEVIAGKAGEVLTCLLTNDKSFHEEKHKSNGGNKEIFQ